MKCPTCRREWDGVVFDNLEDAVEADATARLTIDMHVVEPTSDDEVVLRGEFGVR
jgi:hypothetical protein